MSEFAAAGEPGARRLTFAATAEVTRVPFHPPELKPDIWWTASDYAEIRGRQREIAAKALENARNAPPGTIPEGIPGESRRGLGITCEPSTTSERARRVQRGREEVVRAHRGGMSPAELSDLCQGISEWAAINARQVGEKDYADVRPAVTSPPTPKRPIEDENHNSPVARPRPDESRRFLSGAPAAREAAPGLGIGGGGISGMVRRDSLGDLQAAASGGEMRVEVQGLAGMVRHDSLGDLNALAEHASAELGNL